MVQVRAAQTYQSPTAACQKIPLTPLFSIEPIPVARAERTTTAKAWGPALVSASTSS